MNRYLSYRKHAARLLAAAALLLMAACQADDLPPATPEATEAITFSLDVMHPGTAGNATRNAAATENDIRTLDVLAFDADGLFRRHYAAGELYTIDGGAQWLYRLPLSKDEARGLRFVFLANLHEEVTAAVRNGLIGHKDDLHRHVTFDTPWLTARPDALYPMWGETPDAYDSDSNEQGLNRVSLLRAASTVDVVLNGNATEAFGISDFKLGCVKVCDVPLKSTAAPAPNHFEWVRRQTDSGMRNEYAVTAATVPETTYLGSFQTEGTAPVNAIRGQIVVPESDADGTWNTTFLVGGYYRNDSRLTWYRLNLSHPDATDGTNRATDLLRGKRYILNITRVAAAGHSSPDEALAHPSENISATLELRPETNELTHVAYNARNYLAASSSELHMAPGGEVQLRVLTDADGGWTLDGMPAWLTASDLSGESGSTATISLHATGGLTTGDTSNATLRLSAGPLTLSVTVRITTDGTILYESPYVREALDAAGLGLPDGSFNPGALAFMQEHYLILANNYRSAAAGPSVIVYDRRSNHVVATIESWTHDGQTLNFRGSDDAPDQIDDLSFDARTGRLYVARRQSCVDVFDMSDPTRPVYVSRIGRQGQRADHVKNRLCGSGAVLATERYLLVRDEINLDTYVYADIQPAAFQEITCVTRDDRNLRHSGHQPAQWAVDPVDGSVYLTDWDASFQGIYRIDPARADALSDAGRRWQQLDLRAGRLPLGYRPTGLLITDDKVYVTRLDGTLDIFARNLLTATPATRSGMPHPERSLSLRTATGRPGQLRKLYQDPAAPTDVWSIDTETRAAVRLGFHAAGIEVTD